jgi:hypothetical protein
MSKQKVKAASANLHSGSVAKHQCRERSRSSSSRSNARSGVAIHALAARSRTGSSSGPIGARSWGAFSSG